MVVEYNASISPSVNWIAPFHSKDKWDGTQNFGASLKAYEDLGKNLSYSLFGCDIYGVDAFFVRNDLVGKNLFQQPFTSENHYEPPRYHLVHRCTHPSVIF